MATIVSKRTGKRYNEAAAKIAPDKQYTLEDAVALVKSMPVAKFDQSVDLSFRLGVDPKHADQMVRGAVVLPHGIGKTVRVAVFAKGEKEREAREAGADVIGAEDLVERVQGGWMEFDTAVATPDLMGQVGRLGKVLGPRGLMPNPKLGTVTFDVGRAVREAKAGKVEFRVDKAGNIHTPIGKHSFGAEQLAANGMALIEAIVRAKPAAAKGTYLRSLTVSTTMGPGVPLDALAIANLFKKAGRDKERFVPTQEKVEAVEELKSRLNGVKAVVLTEYRGLTVQQLGDLRKQLRAVSAEYKIVKNRLARLAIASSELQGLGTHLKGPTGVIFSKEDPVAVAKAVHAFARTNQALAVKAGYVEGQMLAPAGLKALADLPSREAIRAQLVGSIQGVLAGLVGVLAAPQRELVYVLQQRGASAGDESKAASS